MKNIFRILMAVAVLFTASCAKEDISSTIGSGEANVTFTVDLPELGTRAYGDGTKATTLRYYVYDGETLLEHLSTELPNEKVTLVKGKASFSLPLLKGMTYNILFWADSDQEHYRVGDKGIITVVNTDEIKANDESRDAFFAALTGFDPTEVTGTQSVTLTRPFAQLNAFATDVADVAKSGVTLNKSTISTKIYTTLNPFAAEDVEDVDGLTDVIMFVEGENPKSADGQHLSMNYLLAPKGRCVANVTFKFNNEQGKDIDSLSLTNIPLQRNYKTNIIGKLLTASTDFNVTIEAGFGTPDETVATDALSLQEAINNAKDGVATVITLGGNIDLNEDSNLGTLSTRAAVAPALTIPAKKNIILDLNGYTLTYSASVWNNNMIQNYGELTIKNGNVVYKFVGEPDTSYGSGNYAIVNSGDLTINANITVQYKEETEKVSHALYAINAGDGNITINGGTIYNKNNHAVRIWGSTESTFTVNDGTIKGARAIWMQLPNSDTTKAPEVTVNITGGNLIATGETGYKLAIYSYTHGNSLENVKFDITGGTFDGDIALSGGSNKEAVETVTISGGTFTDVYSYGDSTKAAEKISITGGTFASLVPLTYLNNANEIVTLNSNIENAEPVSFKGEGTLNLNGKSVSTVDTTEKAFELINNSGKLTIVGEGTLSVNATINSGWNRRSSVISNCPGGNLTVREGVVIEHRGGTDMAYGIDNLTNGKGTYAVTTLEGATVKSTYSAVRQFLNGIEATNELYVNAGTTLVSLNRAIYFQDPSKNPNTGKLVVDAEASVTGKVHLDVTAGSTEWPVEVSVASKALKDDSKVTWENLPAGYSVTEQDGVWTVNYSAAAKIGDAEYGSLQQAIEAVQSGEVILLKDIEQVDGVIVTDKNLTINLNEKTFTVSVGASTNNRNFKINGSSVVTIKNGTMIAAGDYSSGAYGTIRTEGTAKVTLENVKLYNYRGNGLNVKALSGTTVTINDTEIYSQYGGCVESAGGTVELNNVKIEQKGLYTAPYNSMAISVNGGGTVTVNSGTYSTECITAEEANNQGTSHGPWCAGVLNSGGTLIIKGGTFSNDNFGDNTLATYARGLLLADTGAKIQIKGGTFNALKSIIDYQNNLGDASKNPSATLTGGDFSAKPHDESVAEGYMVKEKNGRFTVEEFKPAAKVGSTEYGSIDEAIAKWTNNTTLTLLDNVTLSDVVTLNSTEHHILDLGTYTMTAASGKNAIEVTCNGRSSASYALTINADTTNPGGITATGKACIYYSKSDTTKDRPIIRIYNGVFTGSYSINSKSNGNTNCPQIWIYGGIFNNNVNLTKNMLRIWGGTFHGWINCTGDTSAYREISGGRFKSWLFMTADALGKFWVGTAKDTYDVGLYVDDEGYLVVGGPVITEFGDKFAAKATNATKWSSYLKYSSAAANGLYYTNADMAIKKHGADNVELK